MHKYECTNTPEPSRAEPSLAPVVFTIVIRQRPRVFPSPESVAPRRSARFDCRMFELISERISGAIRAV